jgi:hypothetical protein
VTQPAIQALWLAAPVVGAAVVHMVVVKRGLLHSWAVPLDGGRTVRGAPVFGANKTWRGVAVMIGLSAVLGLVQGAALGPWAAAAGIAVADRLSAAAGGTAPAHAVAAGLLGLAYVLGELPNSFLKRRLAIAPGARPAGARGALFAALDHLDSVAAGLLAAVLVLGAGWDVFGAGLVLLGGVHLAVATALHAAGIKRAP